MINEIECIKSNNTELASTNGRTIYSSYLNTNPPNEIGSYISKKFTNLIEQPGSPANLFRNTSKLAPQLESSSSNLVLDAANKLYNLAKTTGSTVNVNSSVSRKSTNNLSMPPIQFTNEDDEIISDKESLLFWQNLKSLKIPFTNTITLGRKFKRNVLKLSIFNSFSNSISNLNQSSNKCEKLVVEAAEEETPVASIKPNVSYSKNKLLKKRKKLKEMEKSNQELLKKLSLDKDKQIADVFNQRFSQTASNNSIYKTL